MNISLLEKLACPFDKKDLAIEIYKQDEEIILEGLLTCKECNRYYPIVHGIPVLAPDEYRVRELELPMLETWNKKLLNEGQRTPFQIEII